MADHNHGLIFEMGPLKTDWTVACPADLTQTEREEICLSTGESYWGTANLARLETIKNDVDPNSLFVCAAGIGYGPESEVEPEPEPEKGKKSKKGKKAKGMD